jgi:hypothetical protein
VRRWKTEEYPALRAEAQRVGATTYVVDEAGVRSDDHAGTTWAPVGQTPVVMTTGDRVAVNLISAVTAKGALRFAAYDGTLTGPVFIDFCRRLLADTAGPVFLVVDGHPVHATSSESSDVELGFHTDFNFDKHHPERPYNVLNPDYIVLLCLRGDRRSEAYTLYADARDICGKLDPAHLEVMRAPRFQLAASYSFTSSWCRVRPQMNSGGACCRPGPCP